jgi:hypothetical protein
MFFKVIQIISQNASLNESKGRAKATGRRPVNLHRAATRSWAPNHDVNTFNRVFF